MPQSAQRSAISSEVSHHLINARRLYSCDYVEICTQVEIFRLPPSLLTAINDEYTRIVTDSIIIKPMEVCSSQDHSHRQS